MENDQVKYPFTVDGMARAAEDYARYRNGDEIIPVEHNHHATHDASRQARMRVVYPTGEMI